MRRLRRLAIVLVAIGLVTSAVYATGAFSSLGTSRNANVHVAGDKAGYLGLAPGENGEYATYQNGKLQLQLNGALGGEDAPSGGGVNREAETAITSVFTITNQGAQSVGVWLEDTDDHIAFERANGGSLEQQGNAVELAPGDTVHIGLTIDTTETDADQLDTQLIINADSDVAGTARGSHDASQPTDQHKSHQNTTQSKNDQPGSASEKEGPPAPSDGSSVIDADLRELIDQVITAIEDKHSLIKKYEDELWKIAALHPPLLPAVWMLLYPGQVWETTVGAALGAVGMPSGETPVNEAGSALYFGGWMVSSFVPVVGILPDIRDTVQGMVNKDPVASVLGLLSIVPGLGKGGDLAQIGHYTSKWVTKAAKASGVSKVVKMVTSKSGLLSVLPSDVKTKILSKLTDDAGNAKQVDRISDTKMQHYIDEGYNPAQIDDMVTNGKFTKSDMGTFSEKGVNLDRIQTLRGKQVPVEDIRYYVNNDVSLHRVAELRNNQFTPAQARKLSEKGFDLEEATHLKKKKGFSPDDVTTFAEKGTDTNKVKQLKYEGFANDEITEIVSKGADPKQASTLKREGYATEEITDLVKKSDRSYLVKRATLDQVVKLERKGIPKNDIKYYVENGISLKLVDKLHSSGTSSGMIRKRIQGAPNEVKQNIKRLQLAQDKGLFGANAVVNGYNWHNIDEENASTTNTDQNQSKIGKKHLVAIY